MPLFTCPTCRAGFESAGAPGASCPTCGQVVIPVGRLSRRPADDDAPRRRPARRDEDDDYEDDRPARRPRRPASTAADALIPLLIIGGVLFVILAVGGLGYLAYRVAGGAAQHDREVATAEWTEFDGGFAQAPAGGGPPGVDPRDLAPGGGGFPRPNFQPPGLRPPGGPDNQPGIDPRALQPPGGMQPPAFPQQPGLRPPGLPQPPGVRPPAPPRAGGPDLPGVGRPPGLPGGVQPPALPQPPAMPQPPGMGGATAATVTLSNLRRGAGGALQVDYEYTAGAPNPAFDKLVVKTANGSHELLGIGPIRAKGTIRIRSVGPGKFQGTVEVWMERKSPATLPGASGEKISNSVTIG